MALTFLKKEKVKAKICVVTSCVHNSIQIYFLIVGTANR